MQISQVNYKGWLSSIMQAAIAVVIVAAMYWSLRLTVAELYSHTGSMHSITQANILAPQNAEYLTRVSDLSNWSGSDGTPSLLMAANLNPFNAELWIRLGLGAELKGQFTAAERYLLRATEVSKQYEPRWTLANYYFRRNRTGEFWYWTRQALTTSFGDRRPLFRLCWMVSRDASEILHRAIPNQSDVRRSYLSYLIESNRLDVAFPVVAMIGKRATADDVRSILAYCDAMLLRYRPEEALVAWNVLSARKLTKYGLLRADMVNPLTNGSFGFDFMSSGFDWHVPSTAGVSTLRGREIFRVAFSGRQPEKFELIWQYVPVAPLRNYAMEFQYHTEDIAPGTGLRWEVLDPSSGSDLAACSPELSSPNWKTETIRFTPSAGVRLVRLGLIYTRSPGTIRIEGAVTLRSVHIYTSRPERATR